MQSGHCKDTSHRSCPFKAAVSAAGQQEIGHRTSPKEMCTHNCALWIESENACAIRLLALKLAHPLAGIAQASGTETSE